MQIQALELFRDTPGGRAGPGLLLRRSLEMCNSALWLLEDFQPHSPCLLAMEGPRPTPRSLERTQSAALQPRPGGLASCIEFRPCPLAREGVSGPKCAYFVPEALNGRKHTPRHKTNTCRQKISGNYFLHAYMRRLYSHLGEHRKYSWRITYVLVSFQGVNLRTSDRSRQKKNGSSVLEAVTQRCPARRAPAPLP